MENVHNAIAWYQTKIGSYDKQLWEQSVEKKLQKQPPFVLHNAPRKKVRLKTEYIDVDLIRGSTFTKTKPQVPWVYITRKAVARVLFFPFYYNWWVHQTHKKLYALLLVLYVLQVVTVIVYLRNFDHSIIEDELSFTEVILPTFLMFLLCLIHSQTVLAHITHKPPKRSKNISGFTRTPHQKKTSRKGRSSGNNSTCQEDSANTDTSRSSRRRTNQSAAETSLESHPVSATSDTASKKNLEAAVSSSVDVEKTSVSCTLSDYELRPGTVSSQSEMVQSTSSDHHQVKGSDAHVASGLHEGKDVRLRKQSSQRDGTKECMNVTSAFNKLGESTQIENVSCSYIKHSDVSDNLNDRLSSEGQFCRKNSNIKCAHLNSQEALGNSDVCGSQKAFPDSVRVVKCGCGHAGVNKAGDQNDISKTLGTSVSQVPIVREDEELAKSCIITRAQVNEDADLDLGSCRNKQPAKNSFEQDIGDPLLGSQCLGVCEPNFEYTSGSDNLSMSDFEMVEHLAASDVRPPVNDSAQCPVSESWKNDIELENLTKISSEQQEIQRDLGSNVSLKLKPFKSQDSSDSGINNEVSCADCSCISRQQETVSCSMQVSGHRQKWPTVSICRECVDDVSLNPCKMHQQVACTHETQEKPSDIDDSSLMNKTSSSSSVSDSVDTQTVKSKHLISEINNTKSKEVSAVLQNETPAKVLCPQSSSAAQNPTPTASDSSSQLQCFSEMFVQEILNDDTLREMSCSSLLVHSDLENSSSSAGRLSTASNASSSSSYSSCSKNHDSHHIPHSSKSAQEMKLEHSEHHHHTHVQKQRPDNSLHRHKAHEKLKGVDETEDRTDPLDESLEHLNASDGERPSDDISNYNPSDSDADSDGPVNEDVCSKYDEKWKRLRFQEYDNSGKVITSKACTHIATSATPEKAESENMVNGSGTKSVVGILTRKPSPLKDLAIGRKSSNTVPATNSSGSDQDLKESRNQLRRRRRTSGTPTEPTESNRTRSVPTSLGIRPGDTKDAHISSSENETGGGRTPEGSNKATMSSEEWEDRMQSDETTSSAYSSNSEMDSEEKVEEEEKTEYTTSTLHVINLLQPSGSPSSSGNITQPDRVSCVIWEGNECKKVDLTALDIGWAIIDKVDSLPESSDYFLIGLLFSYIISLVPLVFRVYVNRETLNLEELLTWSGLVTKLIELPVLITSSLSWRQYLVMVNGMLQRFFLSLIFFFLLSVADRTFKQRLLYAKHFSYLTSSRRARKFNMPHFRLNKVRNIKIWLSLRSYLKRRGPQRSVDVIVSACFLCAVCTVCLISLQMLKDTDSYLDYLCNWELLVWCTALGVFLMRFMTVGLKINKKYRNLSVLITEQINLYLQMEQKPHKKEELILANNVLRLAEDLLKELESPFKISGFSANPLIYNIMRVVVLSAFSAVLTEVLGFKLKLHKIKLKG